MGETTTRHKTKRSINWRLRFLVMRRDNFKCKICGISPAADPKIILHVDHIKAWANGGETVIENLQTLCSVCNIGKSDL
jgi:5-methylcytosine-specific restriction endonuclease McrA